ncbi:hypothetical protein [Marinomonas transparens]|uniref:Transporter n=1 Tax=Marinomonas transparens TaxID=2795388 RepID=A0A934N2Q5_9GAMM|nr:hypothetical protein [Marinomonas transparens]MBJ7538118.1 hypothetical protein [Marinomonas transparens]
MMFKFERLALIYLLSKIGMAPSLAHAENTDLGYKQGNTSIAANLKIGYDSSQAQASSFYHQPSFDFLSGIKKDTYGLQGRYGYSLFSPEKKKDLAQSHLLGVSSYWSPVSSNTLSFSTTIKQEDEQRGTGLTSDTIDFENKIDSFRYESITGGYVFDRLSQESLIFTLAYALDKKIYNSNRELALNANLEQKKLITNLGYKWGDSKTVYFESTIIQQEYFDVKDRSKDSENKISSLGVTWPLTSISDISIAYGRENKLFVIGSKSLTTNYWLGLLNWSPLTYTEFTLEAINKQNPISKINQTLNESNNLSLKWKHIRNSYHNIIISIAKNKTKEIINNISKTTNEISLDIKNNYQDLDLTLALKKKTSSKEETELNISLSYNFKGVL